MEIAPTETTKSPNLKLPEGISLASTISLLSYRVAQLMAYDRWTLSGKDFSCAEGFTLIPA